MIVRRFIMVVLPCVMITACAVPPATQEVITAQPQSVAVLPKPALDNMAVMNQVDDSVTIYPLTGPIADPFTRGNLQPLSEKVIGEGYVATDPSVTVYPPRLPTAIPALAPMEGVRVDAASSLYSAKVQAMAKSASEPRTDPPPLPIAPIPEDMVMSEMLPPVAEIDVMPRDVPMMAKPLPPVQSFTSVGVKSAPIDTSYGGGVSSVPLPPASPSPMTSTPVMDAPVNTFSLTGF